MIVSGARSQVLAARLAEETGQPLARVAYDRFPDGELRVNVPVTDTDHAVVVASTTDSDAHVQLLQLQDALREAGVTDITTILPYLGYARQEDAFVDGDTISIRAIARAVSTGTDRVLTVNPHDTAVTDHFSVPATAVDAAGRLADPLPEDLSDPLFLGPDEEALDLAEAACRSYGEGDVDYFEKTRYSPTDVEIDPRDVAVAGRTVVLTDDVIETGTTMSEALAVLDERGAERVFATCVHPLLARNAVLELSAAGVETIYGSDTIERAISEVSVAPALAQEL
jgi:ribose-phosphate pyrophosphokinase